MNFVDNTVDANDEDSPEKSLSRQKLIEAQIRDSRNSGYEDEDILSFDFEELLTDSVVDNEKTLLEVKDTALQTQQWRERNKLELEQKIREVCKEEDVSTGNDSTVDENPESELLLTPRSADEAYRRLQALMKQATEEYSNSITANDTTNDTIKPSASIETPRGKYSGTYELPSEEALRKELFDLELHSIQHNVRDEYLTTRIQEEGDLLSSQAEFESNLYTMESKLKDFRVDLDKILGAKK